MDYSYASLLNIILVVTKNHLTQSQKTDSLEKILF